MDLYARLTDTPTRPGQLAGRRKLIDQLLLLPGTMHVKAKERRPTKHRNGNCEKLRGFARQEALCRTRPPSPLCRWWRSRLRTSAGSLPAASDLPEALARGQTQFLRQAFHE